MSEMSLTAHGADAADVSIKLVIEMQTNDCCLLLNWVLPRYVFIDINEKSKWKDVTRYH